jgi:TonB family protein
MQPRFAFALIFFAALRLAAQGVSHGDSVQRFRASGFVPFAAQDASPVDQSKIPPLKLSDIDAEPDVPALIIGAGPEFMPERGNMFRDVPDSGGVVQVGFVVDLGGRARNPFVISSTVPSLNQPSIDGVLKAYYEPALHHGVPVNSFMEVTMCVHSSVNRVSPDGRPYMSILSNWPDSQVDQSKLPPEWRYDIPPKPINTVFPVYPFELLRDHVTGDAEVGFFVSPSGKVVQAVVLRSRQPEFDQALLAMLDQLKFQPAMKDGKPAWAVLIIKRTFSVSGGDVPVSEGTLHLLTELQKKKPALCPIKDLDAQPQLLSSQPPVFPSTIARGPAETQAVVEFIIDHDGNVQLPRVVSAIAPAFGYAAVQGVSAWKFAPPTSHGRPVDIRAKIPVDFTVSFRTPTPAPN